MRLSPELVARLPAQVARPTYDRAAQTVGIVHFGIGAFHRAHQAWYTDAAMNLGDKNWAITGVSLRSATIAQQLNPQDGLCTVAEKSGEGISLRIIGAVRQVIVASEAPDAVIAAVAAPDTCIISLTITEKGYCRTARGELDPDLAHSGSVYYFIAQGLLRRREAGLAGLTLVSCDNLPDNGATLNALMAQYLVRHHPDLALWFEENCTCPATMVDRIVPATTDRDRSDVAQALGDIEDEAAVVTEPFSQWVIEDRFAGSRPWWEAVGVQIVKDVRPYEMAKLRMLNGAHSLLAYCGLKAGYTYVHEAVADRELRALTERLMRDEAAPTITPAPGQDLAAYADALIARFANPALNHRLIQIAMDGSQKIPQRWLETLAAQDERGNDCPAIREGIAAWITHLQGANGPVDDPLGIDLTRAAASLRPVDSLFGECGLLPGIWSSALARA